jgi:hypothetical protein
MGASELTVSNSYDLPVTKNGKPTIKRLSSDRELIRRKKYHNNPPIPKYRNELERPTKFPQTPTRLRKAVWSEEEAPKADQTICRRGRHTSCRYERSEGHS